MTRGICPILGGVYMEYYIQQIAYFQVWIPVQITANFNFPSMTPTLGQWRRHKKKPYECWKVNSNNHLKGMGLSLLRCLVNTDIECLRIMISIDASLRPWTFCNIWPLYVTSSYPTWIFCRRVSGFATDCPCGIWCRGLTTCLLHVGPPFGNEISWAVGFT